MEYKHGGSQGRGMSAEDIPWDRILMITPLVIVGLMVVFLAVTSVYKVDRDEEAVVMRWGKYHNTAPPGLHFCIPLVDQVLKVSVKEWKLRLPFGIGPDRPHGDAEEHTLMLTGDLNAAVVEWTIRWKVSDPKEYLFRFYQRGNEKYPERVLTAVAQAVMNRLVGDYSMDEVITEKRGAIREQAREATQKILDDYKCGIQITQLQMQRVTPPAKVRPYFDEVNASMQRRVKLENEAKRERNKLLPAAKAENDKMVREAEGYAARRRAEAQGEVQALLAKYRAYKLAPDVTRQRLYIEAMQEILAAAGSKVIVDSQLQGRMLPLLHLQEGAQP